MSKRLTVLALTAMTSGLLWVQAPAAHATVLACGAVVVVNTVLENDVGPCNQGPNEPAITIAANRVTLDLNGHRVFGTAATGDGLGVALLNVSESKVINGTISNFDAGVYVTNIGGNHGFNEVSRLTLLDNLGAPGGDAGDGILLDTTGHNTVKENYVNGSGPYGGIDVINGGGPLSAHDNRILSNSINNSRGGQADGIRLEPGVIETEVRMNKIDTVGLDGIALFNTTRQTVVGNVVTNAARDGITQAAGGSSVIQNNVMRNNGRYGIGIGGTSNQLTRNLSRGNARFDLFDANPACDANAWTGNQFGTASPACTTSP